MKRVLSVVLSGLLAGAALPPPATAQQRDSQGCITAPTSIYHAEGRYLNGQVRMCSFRRVFDLTAGSNQARPGEMTFATARIDRNERNGFVRAKPNYPYIIRDTEFDAFHINYVDSRSDPTWATAAMSLPFLPTEVYYLGTTEGIPRYGYGRPAFIPPKRRQAYPIDQNSIIIAMGGIGFMSPDALTGMLSAPDEDGYVEVFFFQKNENPAIFRRAFIPVFQRASVNSEYQQIVRSHQLPSRASGSSQQLAALGFAVATVTALWIGYQAYYRSGFARSVEPDCDANSISCWHDPILELLPD
jgi:hypothetical protein